MRKLLPALLFLLPGVLGAQAATYTYIDQKGGYSNTNGWVYAASLPKLGSNFRVRIPMGQRGTYPPVLHSYLLLGLKNPNFNFPSLGGYLYSSADVRVWKAGFLPQPGQFPIWTTIPNWSQLLGLNFYQQNLQVEVWATKTIITLSKGGHGVIGR